MNLRKVFSFGVMVLMLATPLCAQVNLVVGGSMPMTIKGQARYTYNNFGVVSQGSTDYSLELGSSLSLGIEYQQLLQENISFLVGANIQPAKSYIKLQNNQGGSYKGDGKAFMDFASVYGNLIYDLNPYYLLGGVNFSALNARYDGYQNVDQVLIAGLGFQWGAGMRLYDNWLLEFTSWHLQNQAVVNTNDYYFSSQNSLSFGSQIFTLALKYVL